jgi:hypothetical protein
MRRLGVAGWASLGLTATQSPLPEPRSIVSDDREG